MVVPVDPGPSAAGKPIWGTTQNLPPMSVTGSYFAGPQNAAAIEEYYDSGQAKRDQESITKAAWKWVNTWVDDKCGGDPESCNATVVFDVDETLLSNYGYYKSTGFTFDQDGWNAFNEACKNSAIAPSRGAHDWPSRGRQVLDGSVSAGARHQRLARAHPAHASGGLPQR
jgi:hypothetical protein